MKPTGATNPRTIFPRAEEGLVNKTVPSPAWERSDSSSSASTWPELQQDQMLPLFLFGS